MGMAISAPRYTIDDLDQLPDDGNRYELLDGMLLVTAAPSVGHQVVATRIAGLLMAAVSSDLAQVVAVGAIQRAPRTQLQPDILVFPSRFAGAKSWKDIGEHWLAVEVLSRSSRVYDREFKRDAYFALGVREVWLVDLRDRSVEVARERGVSELVRDVVRWRVPSADRIVTIELAEVFPAAE
jgi:Uma2 family endonuclease